jgi:DNA-binding XRE family transcriptional regulator
MGLRIRRVTLSLLKSYTQEELAITLDCSRKTVNSFLSGELIKWEYLWKLSCILETEIEINFK